MSRSQIAKLCLRQRIISFLLYSSPTNNLFLTDAYWTYKAWRRCESLGPNMFKWTIYVICTKLQSGIMPHLCGQSRTEGAASLRRLSPLSATKSLLPHISQSSHIFTNVLFHNSIQLYFTRQYHQSISWPMTSGNWYHQVLTFYTDPKTCMLRYRDPNEYS